MHQIKRDVCLHDAQVPPCSQLCFSPQEWISDVRAGSAASCGNHIKSSCSLIAFNTEQGGGGVLGLVSLDNGNEEKHSVSQLHCHAALEDHGDQVQSLSWKQDGSLLATSCKDKKLRIFDPRAQLTAVQSAQGHQNNKDCRVIWIGDTDNILSAGFNQMREREVRVWDARKMGSSVGSVSLDTSPGTLIPLFDPDTGLLVLAGMYTPKPSAVSPGMIPNAPPCCTVSQCLTEAATRGIAMVPKLAVDVTSCEVVRVLQLTDSFIVPVSYSMPRKSGQDFHEDLYPDTPGDSPALPAEEWWSGGNKQVRGGNPVLTHLFLPLSAPLSNSLPSLYLFSPLSRRPSLFPPPFYTSSLPHSLLSPPSSPSLSPLPGPSSKLRHTQSLVLHRDTHITNLKGLNLTTPGECDGFCVNSKRMAVPLASAGGQIAVLELSQPGRLPDSAIPTIQNGVAVADFSWDPFEPRRLAVAGEDAKIRVWLVPEGGLKETVSEPQCILQGHTEKIYSVKFHPLASGIIASSSYDLTVRLWDLGSGREVRVLQGHQDQIFSLAWSPDGQFLSTVSKDREAQSFNSYSLLSAMVAKLGNREDPLPQESFEGVDDDEWVRPASTLSYPQHARQSQHACQS
ncbi:coronin-7-like isoform X2 [Huso huso]|uniref:Coronin n=1 Tax=Huso huso TaxID=61971 RepID=A0ABR0Z9W4_HUSHU